MLSRLDGQRIEPVEIDLYKEETVICAVASAADAGTAATVEMHV